MGRARIATRAAALFACSLLAGASAAFSKPARYNTTSGIQAGVLNVHLICHSHDDVGWLKTPEQYYTGAVELGILPSIYYAPGAVQFILDSVVSGLAANPDRRFVVVEQYFFRKWWMAQSAETQALVKTLVAAGQLQFANGGVVMHDEACPTYLDMLDQTTAGARFITDTFGPAAAPRVTSQLDPFGHSATQASVFSSPQAGYTAVFMARMDYEEAALRAATKTPDFAWQASTSQGTRALTLGVFGVHDGYGPPDGLCFDVTIECSALQNPVNDDTDPDAEDVNVDTYVQLVLQRAAEYASTYPSDPDGTAHVPFMMGSDFQWAAAHMNFASIDKLVHYVNLNTSVHGVNLLYSSPAMYAAARLSSQTPLEVRTGDIFPYADGPHSVWSGYFSSRPALKGYVRDSSTVFQAAKQLQTWAGGASNLGPTNPLWLLETAMGVTQHHDAVSGTSKQAVAFDYALRLSKGRAAANAAMQSWLNALLGTGGPGANLPFASCDLANATICPTLEAAATSGQAVVLVLYNSQSHARVAAPVRVPVGLVPQAGVGSWAVLAADGVTAVPAQLLPLSDADQWLRTGYYGASAGPNGATNGATMMWLAFIAPTVPPVGFTTVFLQPTASTADAPSTFPSVVQWSTPVQWGHEGAASSPFSESSESLAGTPTLSNGFVKLVFSNATGLLTSYASAAVGGGRTIPVTQNLMWHTASTGDAVDSQCAGAYIFRVADNTTTQPVAGMGAIVNVTIVTGPIVSEARQAFGTWGSQVIRLWANATNGFDAEWTVGPIPQADLLGKEVISRFSFPTFATHGAWQTDSNGREMQTRVRNQRTQYTLNVTEFVAQNYVPVNAVLRIADNASLIAAVAVTDRSQAGGSLSDGSFDLLVHRRLVWDDSRGVFEALSEPGVNGLGLIARGTHSLFLAPVSQVPSIQKPLTQNILLPLLWRTAALPAGVSPAAWAAAHTTTFSGLAAALPPAVELVTVHSWNTSTLLVRLAHLYEANEDPVLSANVTVHLASLFASVKVLAATEMTVAANQRLADVAPVTYRLAVSADEAALRRKQGDDSVREFVRDDGKPIFYEEITLPVVPPAPAGASLAVTLGPMDIRTFLLTVA